MLTWTIWQIRDLDWSTIILSHVTTTAEILNVRSQCTSSTIICVGGNRYDETFLRLVACANCLNATHQTILNEPAYYRGAYWYFTDGLSFGFSPNYTINQYSADYFDHSSNLRLSWHLQGSDGWRLGNALWLSNETFYKKINLNWKLFI